jgi:serine phosphatase RsbU (regulator of sigma subunit)
MVQTSIQAYVREHPGTRPSDLLRIVNEAVKYNVIQMGDNKYMTITAFSFGTDGNAVYSGLHQNILVYRASTDEIEIIPTVGIWLSPWDIGQASNADHELTLKRGDVLFLYTDGITEARDAEREMFSEKKLVKILKNSGNLETGDIKNNIIDALKGYTINDDVTMVILKRK